MIRRNHRPNKKIWDKLSPYQKNLFDILNYKFYHSEYYPPDVALSQDQVEVIAHNLALTAVWTVGKLPGEEIKK